MADRNIGSRHHHPVPRSMEVWQNATGRRTPSNIVCAAERCRVRRASHALQREITALYEQLHSGQRGYRRARCVRGGPPVAPLLYVASSYNCRIHHSRAFVPIDNIGTLLLITSDYRCVLYHVLLVTKGYLPCS